MICSLNHTGRFYQPLEILIHSFHCIQEQNDRPQKLRPFTSFLHGELKGQRKRKSVWLSLRIICDPFASAMAYVRMHQSELCVCTETVSLCPSACILTKVVEFMLQDRGQSESQQLAPPTPAAKTMLLFSFGSPEAPSGDTLDTSDPDSRYVTVALKGDWMFTWGDTPDNVLILAANVKTGVQNRPPQLDEVTRCVELIGRIQVTEWLLFNGLL